ncbi:hypothetical protein F1559_001117 [Cyanidiococcus yangmingshanensis]|uniref:Uncharacterized protein n=1 Tax=Cyanidiococcus yangmingshanensis TaxID=2690220 RepID=A0A7J7IGD3_9RHOD|nr:hypothetical protein F1559_001117 [Cyanidiococcus yangmingshanensis]
MLKQSQSLVQPLVWGLRYTLGCLFVTLSAPVLVALFYDFPDTKLLRRWKDMAVRVLRCLLKVFGIDAVLADSSQRFRARIWYLRDPLVLRWRSTLHAGYTSCTLDQPGRWMSDAEFHQLIQVLEQIGRNSMDSLPCYGVFGPQPRVALSNRIVTIAYAPDGEPCAFTAMVYLEEPDSASRCRSWGAGSFIVHLGLTMIAWKHRGRRIQSPVFSKCMLLPLLNQRRLGFTITNIGASPAGIGAVSDYFQDAFPDYLGRVPRSTFHVRIARHVLSQYRHEFGCSQKALFDEGVFVVRGSNQADGGGAAAFIKADGLPTSRYRDERCNRFCAAMLDLRNGDEIFQVARVHVFDTIFRYRRQRSVGFRRTGTTNTASLIGIRASRTNGVPAARHRGRDSKNLEPPCKNTAEISSGYDFSMPVDANVHWSTAAVFGPEGKARVLLATRPLIGGASLILLTSVVALSLAVMVISAAKYSWLFIPTHLGTPFSLLMRER